MASRVVVMPTPAPRTRSERQQVRSLIERVLGLRIDLSGWYRMTDLDRRLQPLAHRFRGVKPPRFPTVFETLVNAFACQQLSLEVGLELLNRLATMCNVRRGTGERARHAFPAARDVARLAPARYHAIGFSRQKTHALLTSLAKSSGAAPASKASHSMTTERPRRAFASYGEWADARRSTCCCEVLAVCMCFRATMSGRRRTWRCGSADPSRSITTR